MGVRGCYPCNSARRALLINHSLSLAPPPPPPVRREDLALSVKKSARFYNTRNGRFLRYIDTRLVFGHLHHPLRAILTH